MTAETLGASQVRAIQHADGKYQTRHDKFLHELEYRAHETALQRKRRQEAKASSK